MRPKNPSTMETKAKTAIRMAATLTAIFKPSLVPLVTASIDPLYMRSSSSLLMLGVISSDGYIISAYIMAAGTDRIEAVKKCCTTLIPAN